MGKSGMTLAWLGVVCYTVSAMGINYEDAVGINEVHRYKGYEVHALGGGATRFTSRRRLHQDASGLGSALIGAVRSGDVSEVQRLLDAGADPNYLSSDGRATPLIMAALRDHADIASVLLERGATVGLRAADGFPPLSFAAYRSNLGVLKVLLAAGADPNEQDSDGFNPIHQASVEGHVEVVQELVNAGGDISRKSGGDSSGSTALHFAARGGHLSLVRLLLKLGAQVDAENTKYQQTPLQRAAAANSGSVMLALIEAGANVNHVDIDGDSALYTAAFLGNQEAIEVLLENGADKTKTDRSGLSPRDALCQCTFSSEVSPNCKVEDCESPRRMISLLNL